MDRLTFTYDKRKEQPRTAALVDSLETSLSTLDSFLLVLVGPGLYLPFLVVVLMPTSRSDRCIHTRVLGCFTCRVKKRMDKVARAGLSLSLLDRKHTQHTRACTHSSPLPRAFFLRAAHPINSLYLQSLYYNPTNQPHYFPLPSSASSSSSATATGTAAAGVSGSSGSCSDDAAGAGGGVLFGLLKGWLDEWVGQPISQAGGVGGCVCV